MTEALQLVAYLALRQVAKTSSPRCLVPAFFGLTPPTICVL
jgi:hypothetical protein